MLKDIFNLIFIYGGVASAAHFREVYERRSPAIKHVALSAWQASSGQPGRRRVAEFLYILTRQSLGFPGADPGDLIRNIIGEAASPLRCCLVNGWGQSATFDASVDHAWGKPLLIHAFGAAKQITHGTVIYDLLRDYIAPELAEFAQGGSVFSRPALKLLNDPDCLMANIVSASLINQQKRAAAGVAGYILEASAWNVIGAFHADANLRNDELRSAKPIELARTRTTAASPIQLGNDRGNLPNISMQSVNDVLNLTTGINGSSNYNEVALQGTSAFGTKIKVSGIFVKVRSDAGVYKLLDLAQADLYELAPTMFLYSDSVINAMAASVQRGVPVVAIVDNSDSLHLSNRQLSQLGPIPNMTILM